MLLASQSGNKKKRKQSIFEDSPKDICNTKEPRFSGHDPISKHKQSSSQSIELSQEYLDDLQRKLIEQPELFETTTPRDPNPDFNDID